MGGLDHPRHRASIGPAGDARVRLLQLAGARRDARRDPALARILYWYNAINFLELAQQPGHSHHAEWIELSKPAGPEAKRGTVGPHKLLQLLDNMRWSRPDLVARLDPARLALWAEFERRYEPPEPPEAWAGSADLPWGTIIVVLIWIFFGATRGCSTEEKQPPPAPYHIENPVIVLPPQPMLTPVPTSPSDRASPIFITPERWIEPERKNSQRENQKRIGSEQAQPPRKLPPAPPPPPPPMRLEPEPGQP